jgi:O-acetyl-ADP-ribose deacetylase (regulator of RNase III)
MAHDDRARRDEATPPTAGDRKLRGGRMQAWTLPGGAGLTIVRGDLTLQAVDAIVNAANERLLGGGGVDGAIHAAAGPQLLAACRAIPEVRPGVRCPTGDARITPGFDLPARYVIHTVGPVYDSPDESAPRLAAAHASSLRLAREHGLRSVAFPAISCGVYGYPLDEAAEIALEACAAYGDAFDELRFVLYGADAYDAWLAEARLRFGRSPASR